jgi:hypothetical protein
VHAVTFADVPAWAAWQHHTARHGFEVAFFAADAGGVRIEGCTSGVEEGEPWWVEYAIDLDAAWHTRRARVVGRSRSGARERRLTTDGTGRWLVDGVAAPHLDGCFDVDLESSALTNQFPMRRLALAHGESASAPAAYVRAVDLRVERLEQQYRRLDDEDGRARFDYEAPVFSTKCVIVYDAHGLAIEYPGIGTRIS